MMSYPLQLARTLFDIAKDVPDARLEKAFFEVDTLDLKTKVGLMYKTIPISYRNNTPEYVGLDYTLSYYMFARYLQIADQNSTTTGLKLQTYNGSIVMPDNSRTKRYEAERSKADLYADGLIEALRKGGVLADRCSTGKPYRIGLIK